MILFNSIIIILFGTFDVFYAVKTTKVTPPIQDRIAVLKKKLADQIKNTYDTDSSVVLPINENVEYVDRENEPITPISEKDPRKKRRKYKLNEIRTTRDIGQNFKNFNSEIPRANPEQSKKPSARNYPSNHTLKPIRNGKTKKSKITDVFYRRHSDKISDKWMHCHVLVTPILTGYKTNLTNSKRISYDHPVVIRFIQLLTEDITDHTKDDIHSILYQISNLQLRFFQWDISAIKLLLNVIHRDKNKRHSFKTIKMGLKAIFANWKLDFSSHTDVLMKQSRIFRPPCVKITENEGSTKTSRIVQYTKKATTKKKCLESDSDYDSCKTKYY